MKINEARVTDVLPIVTGDKKDRDGNPTGEKWRRQDFRIEFYDGNDRYPDSIGLSLMNEKIDEFKLQKEDIVSLQIGHNTVNWNGRLITDIKHYGLKVIKRINQPTAAAAQGAPTGQQPAQGMATGATENVEDPDDLPFPPH